MSNLNPLVTIVTVTYNITKSKRNKCLMKCIKSVHNQTYKKIEHIIIDGNSIDNTINILEKYKKLGWIKYISEPDKGMYDAMNKGIMMSKGKYIAFLNSDDYYHNKKGISDCVQILVKSKSALLYSDVKSIDKITNKVVGLWKGNIDLLPFGVHFCHQGNIFQKETLIKYGLYDTKFKISADSDLAIKIVSNNEHIVYTNTCFASYRNGGLSEQNIEINRKEHSSSFYTYIGKYYRLSKTDCYNMWNFSIFKEKKLLESLLLSNKITNKKWRIEYYKHLALFLETPSNNLVASISLTPLEKFIITSTRNFKHILIPEGSTRKKIFDRTKHLLKKIKIAVLSE